GAAPGANNAPTSARLAAILHLRIADRIDLDQPRTCGVEQSRWTASRKSIGKHGPAWVPARTTYPVGGRSVIAYASTPSLIPPPRSQLPEFLRCSITTAHAKASNLWNRSSGRRPTGELS